MTIITLALVWKHHPGQRELRICSKHVTGEKESEWGQKQPKLGRKWDLSQKGKAVSAFLGNLRNNDNEPRTIKPQQNYPLRCVDRPCAHPTETE
jgi:hypothetical protein